MKQFYNKIPGIFLFWVLTSGSSFAQTTNSGKLYVSPETKLSIANDFQNMAKAEFYNDGETYIYHNYLNNGKVDFLENTGITRFIGAEMQTLSGTSNSYLFNVEFNNSSGITPFSLLGEMTIEGRADFTNGILDNKNTGGQIYFGKDAEHINTSDKSHVNGKVTRFGDDNFTFPIGDKSFYRHASIGELTNTSILTDAQYFFENSNKIHSHNLRSKSIKVINDQEYWIIENNGNASGAMITLSWRNETTPSEIIGEPSEETIHIIRWDASENKWIDEGGVVDSNNQTVSTVVGEFGIFTLAIVENTDDLPCELIVYNAVTPNGDGVNDHFVVKTVPENTCTEKIAVEIYNRWGVKVFQTDNYGKTGDLFKGYSSGRLTINSSEQLPTGTYFYILSFKYNGVNQQKQSYKKAGYIYLNGN